MELKLFKISGLWRWHLISDGKITRESTRGFETPAECLSDAERCGCRSGGDPDKAAGSER